MKCGLLLLISEVVEVHQPSYIDSMVMFHV